MAFTLGLLVGAPLGALVMGALALAARSDELAERAREQQQRQRPMHTPPSWRRRGNSGPKGVA